jgi:prophage regulatory protein
MRAVLRYDDLKDIGIPWSRKTVYAKIRAGQFPPPIYLGGNTSAWVAAEIHDWIKGRIAERDNPPAKTLANRTLAVRTAEARRIAAEQRKAKAAAEAEKLARMAGEAPRKRLATKPRKRTAEAASANNEAA